MINLFIIKYNGSQRVIQGKKPEILYQKYKNRRNNAVKVAFLSIKCYNI